MEEQQHLRLHPPKSPVSPFGPKSYFGNWVSHQFSIAGCWMKNRRDSSSSSSSSRYHHLNMMRTYFPFWISIGDPPWIVIIRPTMIASMFPWRASNVSQKNCAIFPPFFISRCMREFYCSGRSTYGIARPRRTMECRRRYHRLRRCRRCHQSL